MAFGNEAIFYSILNSQGITICSDVHIEILQKINDYTKNNNSNYIVDFIKENKEKISDNIYLYTLDVLIYIYTKEKHPDVEKIMKIKNEIPEYSKKYLSIEIEDKNIHSQ